MPTLLKWALTINQSLCAHSQTIRKPKTLLSYHLKYMVSCVHENALKPTLSEKQWSHIRLYITSIWVLISLNMPYTSQDQKTNTHKCIWLGVIFLWFYFSQDHKTDQNIWLRITSIWVLIFLNKQYTSQHQKTNEHIGLGISISSLRILVFLYKHYTSDKLISDGCWYPWIFTAPHTLSDKPMNTSEFVRQVYGCW